MHRATTNPEICPQFARKRLSDMRNPMSPPSKLKKPSKIPRSSAIPFKSLQQDQPSHSLSKILKMLNCVVDNRQSLETVTVRQSCSVYSGNSRYVKSHTKSVRVITSPSGRVKQSLIGGKDKPKVSEYIVRAGCRKENPSANERIGDGVGQSDTLQENTSKFVPKSKPTTSKKKPFEIDDVTHATSDLSLTPSNDSTSNILRPMTITITKPEILRHVSNDESF